MSTTDRSQPERVSRADHARRLRNGLVSVAVLVVLVVGLLLAVPGLHGVAHVLTNMMPVWLGGAIVLEALSCLGYIVIFLAVFDRAPVAFGARVALTEEAFGAVVSLGGAGSLAVGAWLLHERGVPVGQIAERSGILFLLTSAINLITLALFGLGLGSGLLPGPANPLLTLAPAAVAVATFAFFLALPRVTDRYARALRGARRITLLRGAATTIRETRGMLLAPGWWLLGAVCYLWCDIAVLWACFQATGHTPPVAVIVLAYQIGYLVNVLPVPGNVGVLEGSFVAMLVLYHVHATTAAAAAVVYHAIALWIPAGWGTLAFIRLRHSHGPVTLRATGIGRSVLRRRRREVR